MEGERLLSRDETGVEREGMKKGTGEEGSKSDISTPEKKLA